ncbi:MAG: N-acetyl-gamma-glutamyl-phosphate reductase [Myxococcota bacterium]
MKVGVVGATGYAGSELCRWVLEHPSLELAVAVSQRHAGAPLARALPGLAGCTELTCSAWDPEALGRCDVVCFAVPHGEAAPLVRELGDAGPVILDLSADHRHAPGWTYGLAEWAAADIARSRRIAVPGCFATAIELSVAPFVGAITGPVCVAAATGSTGSGVTPSAGTHHPERFANFKAYKVLEHQHVPEIRAALAALGQDVSLAFVPSSAPLDRGIFATCFVPVAAGVDPAERLADAYRGAPLVRIRSGSPEVRHVRGTAFADLSAQAAPGLAVVLCAIDNLGKGAATQAVQCLNLVSDLPVHTGLLRAACLP